MNIKKDKIITEKNNISFFLTNLSKEFVLPFDSVGRKLLQEYGAMFVAGGGALPPPVVVFENEESVSNWQSKTPQATENIADIEITLQNPAMNSLKKAIVEAAREDLRITPRGTDSAKRNYAGTVELWASRVIPGLAHWVNQEKLTESEAARIRTLPPFEQVFKIFALESNGLYFAKDLSKSIIYSVAPPGTSQHIAMLALDINEHDDPKAREILANHGWFQTVISDLPHFTFLGMAENQLSAAGLKKEENGGRIFWIPDI